MHLLSSLVRIEHKDGGKNISSNPGNDVTAPEYDVTTPGYDVISPRVEEMTCDSTSSVGDPLSADDMSVDCLNDNSPPGGDSGPSKGKTGKKRVRKSRAKLKTPEVSY